MTGGAIATLIFAVAPELPDLELGPDAWYTKHQDLALALGSLQVVQLVDLIEATFDVTLTSADVVRAHFATARALMTHMQRRGRA